jgi:hypothetical protein
LKKTFKEKGVFFQGAEIERPFPEMSEKFIFQSNVMIPKGTLVIVIMIAATAVWLMSLEAALVEFIDHLYDVAVLHVSPHIFQMRSSLFCLPD